MEFYTLPFESAKSTFLEQLLSSSVGSYLISQPPRRLGGELVVQTKLTRVKVKEGTLDSVAIAELLTKASSEFNEEFEDKPVELIKFFRFEMFKALHPCDGGRKREYAFIVQYAIPKPSGFQEN